MTKPDISREAMERLANQIAKADLYDYYGDVSDLPRLASCALIALRDELDRVTVRAEAAEARVAELEAALANTVCYGCDMRIGDPQPRNYICVSCKSKRKLLGVPALRTDKDGE